MFEGAAGGPALVDGLAAAVPAELEDADLVDAMKAWERWPPGWRPASSP